MRKPKTSQSSPIGFHSLGVACRSSEEKSCEVEAILAVLLGAGIQQQPHDPILTGTSRSDEGRAAVKIPQVFVSFGLQELTHNVEVASVASAEESGIPKMVPPVQVSSGFQQQPNNLGVAGA